MSEEVPTGLVMCPACQRAVPDANICVCCGNILKEIPLPRLTPMEKKILRCLQEGASSIDDILNCADGSKESVRVVMSNMVKFGLARRHKRGQYTLTEAGKRGISG